MKLLNYPFACLLSFFYFIAINSYAQNGVLTQHNDLNRTGWYSQETILNTQNIKAGSFGKIFTRTVDDQIYAQPLVMLHVSLSTAGKKNVVFIATVNNTVYAFDADSTNVTNPYWQVNLSPAGTRAPKNSDMTGACGGSYRDFSGNIGIVGTPVIDAATNTLYVVARSVNTNNVFEQYLHALDITTGAEKPNSPQLITAQVPGNGDGNIGGIVYFNPQKQNQRCGLLLVNGVVYIAYASHCDWGPYHGWILGYDKTTLIQTRVYNTTPNGYFGGIWMSGAAPAADESGNIYASSGNGSVGNNGDFSNLKNRSESALKLTPSGTSFTVSSFFSPMNIAELETADLDFGVTQMLLIPGTTRVMTACKDGRIYLMNRDNMGGYNANANNVVQTIDLGINAHLRSSFAYYKGTLKEFVYSWSENALLKAFSYNRLTEKFDLGNTISSGIQGPVGNNGALLSVSSDGAADSTAVLWTSHAANGDANQSVRPGILRAFDATDVTKELWNSSEYQTDNPGNYAKFNCPTIINGKVYLATFSNRLVVYGLLKTNAADTCNTINIALNKIAGASSIGDIQTPASAAFDGNSITRWSSANGDPQSVYVDLGKRYDLCKIILKWDAGLGKDFKIQLSDDAVNWTTYISITGNTSFENNLPVKASARYVRLYGTAKGTATAYSVSEFEVYGKESTSHCAEPSVLSVTNIYENAATLNWNANGANSFTMQYKTVSAGNWTTVGATTNSVTLNGLACATDYLFKVQPTCADSSTGNYSATTAFSTLSCNANCGPLPTRWTTQDLGDVGIAGSACYSNAVFTLKSSGDDIWNTADAYRFAYTTNVGDIEIKTRVTSLDNTNDWNKCGLMIRESLTPGSRHAFVAITSGNGVAFQNRIVTDAESYNINTGPGIQIPYWIKLVKKGSVYTAYNSVDNINWVQLGIPVNAAFGADSIPVYAGLALTSHSNNNLATATADNYQLTSGTLPLQLLSFNASLSLRQTISLQWVTAFEKGVKDFIVQKSTDNNLYKDIATVNALNNGQFTETYYYEDRFPVKGINYYRLKITGLDGAVTYSAVASATLTGTKAPFLSPNPASGMLYITQGSETIKFINMYDIGGRLVNRITNASAANVITIPVNNLANSTYIVEMRTATTVYKEKLVVHN